MCHFILGDNESRSNCELKRSMVCIASVECTIMVKNYEKEADWKIVVIFSVKPLGLNYKIDWVFTLYFQKKLAIFISYYKKKKVRWLWTKHVFGQYKTSFFRGRKYFQKKKKPVFLRIVNLHSNFLTSVWGTLASFLYCNFFVIIEKQTKVWKQEAW